ncbi:MAG: hypothetical protein IJ737_06035 [Ruminococcus sp.]|nr:hypothetical protein [Ruminococcus sp.]
MEGSAAEKRPLYRLRQLVGGLTGRYLYPFLALLTLGAARSVFGTVRSVGFLVYYTAGNDVMGVRPNRLFGLFSLFGVKPELMRTAFTVLLAVLLLFTAHALYLFVRRIDNGYGRLGAAALFFAAFIFFESSWTDALFVPAFILGLTAAAYGYYALFFSEKKKWAAPVLAAVSVIADCRMLLMIVPVSLVIYFRIKKNRGKSFFLMNILAAAAAAAVFILMSAVCEVPDDDTLEQKVTQLGETYPESCGSELAQEVGDYFENSFKFEKYCMAVPIVLAAESFGFIGGFKDFVFDESFELYALMFIGLLLVGTSDREEKAENKNQTLR